MNDVQKLLFLGSSCIYPRVVKQPIKEDRLLTGILEPTNEPYAVAKIAGIKMCESYNRQYGRDYRAVMPTNLYGPGDNYHLENSHVVPALIRRFHEAKKRKLDEVVVWGSGAPKREFLYVDDMAEACLFIHNLEQNRLYTHTLQEASHVNIGSGEEVSIKDLALLIKSEIGFTGELVFDYSKPDGTPRKLLDTSCIHALGWKPSTSLKFGINRTYSEFLKTKEAL